MATVSLLFVHGDYHGAWCWDLVRSELEEFDGVAVDLPSSGRDARSLGSRDDDIVAMRELLDRIDGPTVIVVHSASGIAVSDAFTRDARVVGVVFVAAVVLDRGETAADVLTESPMDWVDLHQAEGYIEALHPRETFYHDVPAARAEAAIARLAKKSARDVLAPAAEAISDRVWPSAYVVCDQDRAIDPSDERSMSSRATLVEHLDSSHSPFLSMPEATAALIRSLVARFADGERG